MIDELAMEIKPTIRAYYFAQENRMRSEGIISSHFGNLLGIPNVVEELPEDATKEEKEAWKKRKKARTEIIKRFIIEHDIPVPPEEFDKKAFDFLNLVTDEYHRINKYLVDNHSALRKSLDKVRKEMNLELPKKITEAIENSTLLYDASAIEVKKGINAVSKGIITTAGQMEFVRAALLSREIEESLKKPVVRLVRQHPLWIEFLQHVDGCGELLAGAIISTVDMDKVKSPSSIMALAGDDTVPRVEPKDKDKDPDSIYEVDQYGNILMDENGNKIPIRDGRSKKREHLITREYISKKGEKKEKLSVTYNPWFKTKMWLLSNSFVRVRINGEITWYGQIYYDYRARLDEHWKHMDKKKAHKNAMALRYARKMFYIDLYQAWCLILGRTPRKSYHEEKLGMAPHTRLNPALRAVMEKYDPSLIQGR